METADCEEIFDSPLIFHRQKEALDALKKGEINDLRISHSFAADKIVAFGLDRQFLLEGLKAFPDPRKLIEIPIEVLLLPQILQRLHNEHSLLLAPYMLNNADLITRLGYNANVLENGFNARAKKKRETCFHGETLKHLLGSIRDPKMLVNWFNKSWLSHWRANAPGRTHQYILDGMKLKTARPNKRQREGSGVVSDNFDNVTYGYKAVWLEEIIDRKGVIVAMTIVPIQVHDLEAARSLIDEFNFEEGATLICDRGFVDGAWISDLKTKRKVNIVIPLKKNMEVVQAAVSTADHQKSWQPHPTRENQQLAYLSKKDLFWKECPVLNSGALVRWINKKTGEFEEVLFVSTLENKSAAQILKLYDQRPQIEESHRELKTFHGIETLPSGKLTHVIFRIIMSVLGLNLLRLFLNSEGCDSLEDFTVKTLRQKRKDEPNPDVIVYSKKSSFAVIAFLDLLLLMTELKRFVLEKLSVLIKNLKLQSLNRNTS